jgi:hypothetical protein
MLGEIESASYSVVFPGTIRAFTLYKCHSGERVSGLTHGMIMFTIIRTKLFGR